MSGLTLLYSHTHTHCCVTVKALSVLVCKQVIIYIRVMAVSQHASVSFASNQHNGLSDKEGGTLTQHDVT